MVCALLGTPEIVALLPTGEQPTYQNLAASMEWWWNNTVIPLEDAFADEIETQLFPAFGLDRHEYRLTWDRSQVPALQDDEIAKHQMVREDYRAGVIDLFTATVQLGGEVVEDMRGVYHPSAAPKGSSEDSTKAVDNHFSESEWVREKGRFHRYVGSERLEMAPDHVFPAHNLPLSGEYDAPPRNNAEKVRRRFIEAAQRHNIFDHHKPLLETDARIKELEKYRWEIEWDDFKAHQEIDDELKRLEQVRTKYRNDYQKALKPFLEETYLLLNPTAPSNLIQPDIDFSKLSPNSGTSRGQRIQFNPDALAVSLEACKKISKIIHRPDFNATSVKISIADRSAFDPNTGKLEWKPSDGMQGLFHELGHVLEKNNPSTMRQAIRFLRKRTQGNSPRKLIEVYPDISNGEALYLPDQFYEEYVGRLYRYKGGKYDGEISGTEITACDIHMLLTAPHILAHADPEHFQFTYNVLQGEL